MWAIKSFWYHWIFRTNFGGENHHYESTYESIEDRRHGGTRYFTLPYKIKAKLEAHFNYTGVQDKLNDIKNKRKR